MGRIAILSFALALTGLALHRFLLRGVDFETVWLPDGTGGLYVSGSSPTDELVLVTHGGLLSKETMLPYCYEAVARGMDCLLVDLLGHGANRLPATGPPRCSKMTIALAAILADQRWRDYRRRYGIGHSLGSVLLCRDRVSRLTVQSVHVGRGEACRGRPSLHGTLFTERLGYSADHILEPWNPFLIQGAMEALGKPTGSPLWRISLRSWLPWLGLLLGLVGVSSLPLLRPYGNRVSVFLEKRELAHGGLAALLMIATFGLLVWRRIVWPVPWQPSDVFVVFLHLPASLLVSLGVERSLRRWRWRSLVALPWSAIFAVGIAVVLSDRWRELCPYGGVVQSYPGRMAVAAALLLAFSWIAGPRSPRARCVFAALLITYALMLMTPGFDIELLRSD